MAFPVVMPVRHVLRLVSFADAHISECRGTDSDREEPKGGYSIFGSRAFGDPDSLLSDS